MSTGGIKKIDVFRIAGDIPLKATCETPEIKVCARDKSAVGA